MPSPTRHDKRGPARGCGEQVDYTAREHSFTNNQTKNIKGFGTARRNPFSFMPILLPVLLGWIAIPGAGSVRTISNKTRF